MSRNKQFRKRELGFKQYRKSLRKIKSHIKDQLYDGLANGSNAFADICEKLLDSYNHLWTFASNSEVEPTNN